MDANTDPSLDREREIFLAALERPSPGERAAFLDRACGKDGPLRARLEALLRRHSEDSFLEEPAADLKRTLLSEPLVGEGVGAVIGRYKLLQEIGEGGMGVVYMAQQEEPVRRRVALKIIKLGMDTKQVVARFEAERQALALMDHPNIAKVLDGGATDTGRPYFVMELVQGVPITEFCDRNRLPAAERIELFIPVCQAIQSAHQKGIIHRDLKPTNILVTLNAGAPMPMVIDFGVAKATNQKLTEKTFFTHYATLIGTPAYMSPEQAEMSRLDVDTRSDIYGLGVLLYELLTGTTPFPEKRLRSASYHEMQRIILEEEPERPSTRLSTLAGEQRAIVARNRGASELALGRLFAGDLDWIVMKCLEKDRARRYATANGLAADLKRHLNNEPVVARPPSTVYRLQKAWRRHKLAFTAAAVMAGALVVGTTVSSWQAIEASTARNAEKEQRLAAQTERDKAQAAHQAEKQARLRADAEKTEAGHLLYVANINLAQQAWDQNNIGRLRQLLEETPGSPHRGFEWYYWERQTHLALKTLRGHLDAVASAAFSPDGQRIVTGSWDGTAEVWDAASGKELVAFKGHRAAINAAAFSPDGQRIVTGSDDRTAKVWEAASGHELVAFQEHNGAINSVAYSPDGQRIVTGSSDKTARVWEAASGKCLFTLQGHTNDVMSVTFSQDGRRIVTGSLDYTARVWDAASGKQIRALSGHPEWILSVAYSTNGPRIVTGSYDRTAKVWDAASGRELRALQGHTDRIESVAFSPDGQRIVTGSDDRMAKVWEAASGKEMLAFKGHTGFIVSVAFSPDGQRIVTGSRDQTAKVWEASGDRELLTLKGHRLAINSVAFSPDGRRAVTGSDDHTAKVWEAASGRLRLTLKGHSCFDLVGGLFPGRRGLSPAVGIGRPRSGRRPAASQCLRSRGTAARFILWPSPRTASGLSPAVRIRRPGCGKRPAAGTSSPSRGTTLGFHSAAFSPDGQRIVTGSRDNTAKVWEAASGKCLFTLEGHAAPIWSVAFSPHGQRIVTGSADATAKVWEAASGKELPALKGHSGAIWSVAFSPDGERIVTGSQDQTAKLWEAASGRELLTLKGHSAVVGSVAFSPDGRRIATGSRDQTARVWEAAGAEQVAAWQQEERAAAQSLAVRRAERTAEQERLRIARARDSIKQWLVLAPIALAPGQSGAEGLDLEQLEGEGRLRPKAGEARSIGGGELKWRAVALDDYVINFNAILGRMTEHSVAYAVCYLRSETEQHGLQMLVASDDQAKVYLNGKQIYKSPVPRAFVAEQDLAPGLALNAGLNVLVFKVVNEVAGWMGAIRFTDAQGNPVKGIQVTLEPGGNDLR